MSLPRRQTRSIIVIFTLVFASVFTLMLFRGSYNVFLFQRDGVRLRRRDGSNITFDLPWPFATKKLDVKDTLLATGSLLNDIKEVTSSIFDTNFDTAGNMLGATSRLPTVTASNTLQVSTMLKEGSNAVDQATSVLGEINAVATSLVWSILAAEKNPSNIGALGHQSGVATILPQQPTPFTSEPQEFLPHISLTVSNTAHNSLSSYLTPTSISGLTSSSENPPEYSYSTVASSPATPSIGLACPVLTSVTWTITEIWHSTHYEQTTTIFSFASILTVTCAETVSICPSLTSYSGVLANTPMSNQPSFIACAAGVYATHADDCPDNGDIVSSTAPVLPTPSVRPGSSANAIPYGVVASAAAVLSGISFASIIGTGVSSPSGVIRNLSALDSLTSLGSEVSVTTLGSEIRIFTCSDGITVQASQNCLDSVLRVAADSNIVNTALGNVNSALSGVSGPIDALPSAVIADVASGLSAAHTIVGNTQVASTNIADKNLLPSNTARTTQRSASTSKINSTPTTYLKDNAIRSPLTTTIALPSLNGLVNVPAEQLSAALGGLKRRRDFKREESGDGVGGLWRTLEY